jgi:hypothetical protein
VDRKLVKIYLNTKLIEITRETYGLRYARVLIINARVLLRCADYANEFIRAVLTYMFCICSLI